MNLLVAFLPSLVKMLALAPVVIQGIQQLHAEKDSATKTQLAHDSLQLASGVAAYVDPNDAATIGALSAATHAVIQSVGGIGGSPAPVAVAPVAVVAEAKTAEVAVVPEVPALDAAPVWK